MLSLPFAEYKRYLKKNKLNPYAEYAYYNNELFNEKDDVKKFQSFNMPQDSPLKDIEFTDEDRVEMYKAAQAYVAQKFVDKPNQNFQHLYAPNAPVCNYSWIQLAHMLLIMYISSLLTMKILARFLFFRTKTTKSIFRVELVANWMKCLTQYVSAR